jgi:hypothetical protein
MANMARSVRRPQFAKLRMLIVGVLGFAAAS